MLGIRMGADWESSGQVHDPVYLEIGCEKDVCLLCAFLMLVLLQQSCFHGRYMQASESCDKWPCRRRRRVTFTSTSYLGADVWHRGIVIKAWSDTCTSDWHLGAIHSNRWVLYFVRLMSWAFTPLVMDSMSSVAAVHSSGGATPWRDRSKGLTWLKSSCPGWLKFPQISLTQCTDKLNVSLDSYSIPGAPRGHRSHS